MNWETVLNALAIGVPSVVTAVLVFRVARKKDAATEQSGVAAESRAGTTQVIEGYQGLLKEIRQGITDAEKRCEDRINDAVADLKEELNKRPTKEELLAANGLLLDANGKLRKQLLDLGETPSNGLSPSG